MLHVSSCEDTTAVSCYSFTAPGVLVVDADSLTQNDQNQVIRFCFQTEDPSSSHQNQNPMEMSKDAQYQPAGFDLQKLQNKNVSEAADEEENLRNRYQPRSCYSSDCLKGAIKFQALSCWPQII